MGLEIKCIKNKPINSNCYVVFDKEISNSCLVIDPGEEDCKSLIRFIKKTSLSPEYIILTHEHFDHIWGVNKLKQIYKLKVICSDYCSTAIINSKKNMSVFFNQIGFVLEKADIIITQKNEKYKWNEIILNFFYTPGHSKGSMSLMIDNVLFTGDTIIQNIKTITKLPGGNKEELKDSIDYIFRIANSETLVMSGHGNSFYFKDININMIL